MDVLCFYLHTGVNKFMDVLCFYLHTGVNKFMDVLCFYLHTGVNKFMDVLCFYLHTGVNKFRGRGIQLVQRKKTIYPEWNTCFDAHLYEGRVIQMIAMERPNKFLADTTVSGKALADKCTDSSIVTAWLDLKPSGRLQCQIRYFTENEDEEERQDGSKEEKSSRESMENSITL
ncbi:KPCD-like protein [Mya arenaria]|uniref:KPCD-like protein n=1 Tax=Mya arenaria TaxID=6604 RepID=A0ABY7FWM3_MYAAR|nr:KPCD-like protein [Mya arenaria]